MNGLALKLSSMDAVVINSRGDFHAEFDQRQIQIFTEIMWYYVINFYTGTFNLKWKTSQTQVPL